MWPRIRPFAFMALVWVVVPLAIMALAWQPLLLTPEPGADASWEAGLAMAIHSGIAFGDRAVFTYGPLGFMQTAILWYGGLGIASFVYTVITRFALATALYVGGRRTFNPILAFVFAVIVASLAYSQQSEWIIALIAMIGAATRPLSRRQALLAAAAAGAGAGIELLGKFSTGITLTAMAAALIVSLPGRRRLYAAVVVGALLVALVFGWLLTGQDIGGLPAYIKNSIQETLGYAGASSSSTPGWGWQPAAAIVVLVIGVWAALQSTELATSRQRLSTVLIWIVFWFFIFKEGFVRNDIGHAEIFFTAMLAGLLAFRWRRDYWFAAVACGALLLSLTLAVLEQPLSGVLNPTGNPRVMFDQARDVLSPGRRSAITAAGRAAIRAAFPLDQETLSLLRGQTVAIYPTEVTLAWAYGMDWDPIPVLQSYSAYTSDLDRLDASFLDSARAPQRILVQPPPVGADRIVSFEEPLTSRAMLCRYRELHVTKTEEVLGLGPNRCSAPTPLTTVRAHWGQSVSVPPPPNNHSVVFARVTGTDPSGFERLTALLYKPSIRLVLINGNPSRLITATADDGLPLRAAAGIDFTPPFNIAVDAHTISVTKQGTVPTGGGITYSFYAQSFNSAQS